MYNFVALKVLLATTCFVVVATETSQYDNLPNGMDSSSMLSSPCITLKRPTFTLPLSDFDKYISPFFCDRYPRISPSGISDSVGEATVSDNKVIGEDVAGAIELMNTARWHVYGSKQSEIHDKISFPQNFLEFTDYIITKIKVVIEKSDIYATSDVIAINGGLHQTHVTLMISAKNSSILNYRVIIFGTPPPKCQSKAVYN